MAKGIVKGGLNDQGSGGTITITRGNILLRAQAHTQVTSNDISLSVPATHNDVVIAAITHRGTTSFTPPAGWTQVAAPTKVLDYDQWLVLYARQVTEETTSVTFAAAQSPSGRMVLSLFSLINATIPTEDTTKRLATAAVGNVTFSKTDSRVTIYAANQAYTAAGSWTFTGGLGDRIVGQGTPDATNRVCLVLDRSLAGESLTITGLGPTDNLSMLAAAFDGTA